jgi:hypothetical protein
MVLTCAHVIDDLNQEMRKKRIPPEQRTVQFVYSLASGNWRKATRPFTEGARLKQADFALIDLIGAPIPVEPVIVADANYVPAVGDAIAVCGYAHGSILLRRGKKITRFGPLLLPGAVAALSPFDVARPDLILLSVVAARCASGSPVFHPETGHVIGVLVEGQEGKGAVVSAARAIFDDGGDIKARFGEVQAVWRGPAGAG